MPPPPPADADEMPPPPPVEARGMPPPPPVEMRGMPPPPPAEARELPPPPPVETRVMLPPPPVETRGTPPPPPVEARELPPPPVETRGMPPPPPAEARGMPPPPPAETRGMPPPMEARTSPSSFPELGAQPPSASLLEGWVVSSPPKLHFQGAAPNPLPEANSGASAWTQPAHAGEGLGELRRPHLEISEQDLRILDDLEKMAQGETPSLDTEKVRPARMVASLIRLLIRKGVIHELEFLEELARK